MTFEVSEGGAKKAYTGPCSGEGLGKGILCLGVATLFFRCQHVLGKFVVDALEN